MVNKTWKWVAFRNLLGRSWYDSGYRDPDDRPLITTAVAKAKCYGYGDAPSEVAPAGFRLAVVLVPVYKVRRYTVTAN